MRWIDFIAPEKAVQYEVMNNIYYFHKRLMKAANRCGFSMISLGEVVSEKKYIDEKNSIYLMKREIVDGPRGLIAAGFHGDEIAGPWGVVNFLENTDLDIFDNINISIIPLVNPMGFRLNMRSGGYGLDANRGYIETKNTQEVFKLSREGEILKSHQSIYKDLGKDGLICLHEAPGADYEYFIYGYEKDVKPGNFTNLFKEIEAKFFMPFGFGYSPTKRDTVVNSIVFKRFDGGFQDWLFRGGMTDRAVVTETPGNQPLELRIKCNVEMIDAFINWIRDNV